MNKLAIKKLFYTAKTEVIKHMPSILTGMAALGVISTTAFAIYATNEAKDLIDDELAKRINEKFNGDTYAEDDPEININLTKKEVFCLVWKNYIPTAVMGAATLACIIGANTINLRRQASIAALYSLSETNFKEYKEKVLESFGKNKEEKVSSESKEEKVKSVITSLPERGLLEGYGDTLCYDSFCGRIFRSDLEKLRQIQNDLNFRLLSEMWISLNDFYGELDIRSCKAGYDLGWTVDHMMDLKFDAILLPNGEPCIYIDYNHEPIAAHGWN